MKFGTKYRDDNGARKEDSGPGGRWIKYFRDKETEIRFLEEIPEWTSYWEHFSQSKMRAYPCTGERDTCPGCTSEFEREAKAAKRYLVNALVKGYVDVYKIPSSLIGRLENRADRDDGSIRARNYTIIKTGAGTDTEYDVEREEKAPIDFDQYKSKMADHEKMLQEAYIEAWGKPPGVPDDGDAPAPMKPLHVVKDEPKAETVNERIDRKEAEAKAAEPSQVEEVEVTEDELRKKTPEELRSLIEQCGLLPPPETAKTSDDLADYLVEMLA